MYQLDYTVLPFLYVAAVFSGFAISNSLRMNRIRELEAKVTELQYQIEKDDGYINELITARDENKCRLRDSIRKIEEATKILQKEEVTDYSDMPALIPVD